ncbi:MAG: hypothetical protein L6Q60_10005 [Rhodocyclaceae bacterium]|nr:hypothetical protein [Rhodocyclaceae bacterium]
MKTDSRWLLPLSLLLAACTTMAPPPPEDPPAPKIEEPLARPCLSHDEAPVRAMLAFYASNARSPAPPTRERGVAGDPYLLMRQAIQYGQGRPADLHKAQSALDAVMRSTHPAAPNLAPLARLLHEQYGERLRLEQQLRDTERRGDQLQEKLDALTAIERSLPARSSLPRAPQENSR